MTSTTYHPLDDIIMRVREEQLLWLPNDVVPEALEALGGAAAHFGGWDDSDIWVAPASLFSVRQRNRALEAGGKVVKGYSFYYPCRVPLLYKAGITKWCGDALSKIGFALRREVAEAVRACSYAAAKMHGIIY
jgi:hypothetical protein